VKLFYKRWRMALVAITAALAITATSAGVASASTPNGEGQFWTPETVNNGELLQSQSMIGEARQGNTIVEVWRGASDNHVWININHGGAFQIGDTTTFFAPTVVAWGPTQFMIFHVGTDQHIYYTWINPANGTESSLGWQAVPGQITQNQVSVTRLGSPYSLYMVYRSATDNRIWGTSFFNSNGDFPAAFDWGNITNIDGGESFSAPSVTYDPGANQLWAAARGLNNEIYLNTADAAGLNWGTWEAQGGNAADQVQIAATGDGRGNIVVSYRDPSNFINFGAWGIDNGFFTGFGRDFNNWQTFSPIFLSVFNAAVYAIATGTNGGVYWKQAFNSNSGS
jgi:hypothetical protein